MNTPRRILAASILAFATGSPALAQVTWDGEQNANWSTALNWLLDVEPTAADDVIFPIIIPATGDAITLAVGENARSLSFLESYTLTGGDLTLATGSISVDSLLTATIQSALGGTDVTKEGAGTLVLGGTNTFTGTFTINAGTVSVTLNANLGLGAAMGFGGPGTLLVGGTFTSARSVSMLGAGRIDVTAANTFTVSGSLSGSSTLTKGGTGTLELAADNSAYTGKLVVTEGKVSVGADNNFGAVPGAATADAISLSGGGLDFTAPMTVPANRGITVGSGGGTISLGANDVTFSNSFTGGGALLFTGGGTAVVSSTAAGTMTTAATVTVDTGTTVRLAGSNGVFAANNNVGGILLNAGSTLMLDRDSGGELTVQAPISGDGALVMNGSTTTNLTGLNTFTGGIVINSGTLRIGNNTANNAAGTGPIDIVAGTLAWRPSTGSTFTFNNIIAGAGNMTKENPGTVVLTGSNPLTGNLTTFNSGAIRVEGEFGSIAAMGSVIVGDNNGHDETLTFGSTLDVWTGGTLNRISDTATLSVRSAHLVFNGPDAGSSSFSEAMGPLELNQGYSTITLAAAPGQTARLTASTLTRSGSAVALVRGSGLGGTTGTPDSIQLTFGSSPVLVGAGGAPGTNTQTVVNYLVGDTSPTGPGSTFLTYNAAEGLIPLVDGEFDGTLAGPVALRNVSLSAADTVSTDTVINALRLRSGGGVTINGARTTLGAAAVLAMDNATIDGTGTLDFGTAGAVLTAASHAGATLAVNSVIGGTGGISTVSSGSVVNTVALGGDNRFLGGVFIQHGTLRVDHPGALNDNAPGTLTLRAATSTVIPTRLLLNGYSVVVNNLASGSGTVLVENGVAGTATLNVFSSANSTFNGQFNNGATGTLAFIKSGGSTLTMQATSAFSGTAELRVGGVTLSGNGNGRWTGVGSLEIFNGATLLLSNTNGNLQGDRIRSAAPITMRGGVLDFSNDGSANNFTETLGALTIAGGGNTVTSDQAGSANQTTLTFASLARNPGTVLNFTAQNNGTAANASLGADARNRIVFTSAPGLNDGLIGGWAFVGGGEFATYNTSGTVSVATYGGSMNDLADTSWDTTTNVKLTVAGTPALGASRTVNSLHFADGVNLDIGAGNILNVDTGGLLLTGTTIARSISNGTLTAAGGSIAPDLSLRAEAAGQTTTVNSVIDDNGANTIGLVKSGGGTVVLAGTNTYDGPTTLTSGFLQIGADSNLGSAPAIATPGHLKLYGGTLVINQSMTLAATRGLEIGGNAATATPTISIASGTAGLGRTLTYTGAITGVGDASFIVTSNATTTNVDPGRFNGTLSSPMTIGGDFRLEAGSLTLASGANVVGRDFQVALNGTASVTQSSGSLRVGAGHVGDVFDIGVSGSDTINKVGTLNLAGTTDLTVNVELVRIGVVTSGSTSAAQGIVTLATNNTISARTSFIVSDSGAAGLSTSTVNFGAGQNTIITPFITLGGRKGPFTGTVPTGGTLRIEGFRDRSTDLFVGRQNVGTSGHATHTLNITNGTFAANLNTFTIGQKTSNTTGAGGATATVTLGTSAANFIETNSLVIGDMQGALAPAVANTRGFGTLNFGGGEFNVSGNVSLGLYTVGQPGTGRGLLNISGGTFRVGGDVLKTNDDRSGAVITMTGGALVLRDTTQGDTTDGTLNLSQLIYRGGAVDNVAAANLDARSVTDGITFGAAADALILRDVVAEFPVNLVAPIANTGGIRYEAAGGGFGGEIGGDVNLGSVSRTVTVEDSGSALVDLRIDGAIVGAGTLAKAGAGNLALVSTVAGGVDVIAGTLSGTAIIAGPLNVAASAVVSPGFSAGTTSSGNLNLAAGSTFAAELFGSGNAHDQLNVTGSVSIGGANLSLSASGSYTTGDLFFLILNDGADSVNGVFANLPPAGVDFYVGANTFQISYEADGAGDVFTGGNDVALLVVPEPGSAMLLLGGLGALGMRRIRRKN